ncbi:MAG TPA: hypothetical protein VMI32_06705 [Candidatus Solibacter sp.]|nr:hypothetical protein [Candidatus Solibacter sp.]
MDLRWSSGLVEAMWRIVSRLEGVIGSWLELVGAQLVVRIEVKRDAGGGGPKSLGIDMTHYGDHGIFITRILEVITPRFEEVFNACSLCAGRKLGAEHLINFFKMGVGGVILALTSCPEEH